MCRSFYAVIFSITDECGKKSQNYFIYSLRNAIWGNICQVPFFALLWHKYNNVNNNNSLISVSNDKTIDLFYSTLIGWKLSVLQLYYTVALKNSGEYNTGIWYLCEDVRCTCIRKIRVRNVVIPNEVLRGFTQYLHANSAIVRGLVRR